jgi:class 3 adenylate cyclase
MSAEEILGEIRGIFGKKWTTRDGRKVPDTDAITFGNEAVTFIGTVLYADMADSTGLVNGFRPWFAAEVYKAYLLGACRVIRAHGGEVTAFDGDRVMAVFLGEYKNTLAVKTALKINFLVHKTNEIIRATYPTTSYILKQTVGVDVSPLFVAKTGVRKSNDLVWVGRAANYAAKLSALGEPGFSTYITDDVFALLNDEAKYGGQNNTLMWERRIWTEKQLPVHRSNWWWSI